MIVSSHETLEVSPNVNLEYNEIPSINAYNTDSIIGTAKLFFGATIEPTHIKAIALHRLAKKRIKIYHILELLQMAIGENPMPYKAKKERVKQFFRGIMKKQLPKTMSKKTFKIADISEKPPDTDTAY